MCVFIITCGGENWNVELKSGYNIVERGHVSWVVNECRKWRFGFGLKGY